MDQLLQMKIKDGVNFDHLASVYERYTGKIALENLRPSWFIFSVGVHTEARHPARQADHRYRGRGGRTRSWRRRSWRSSPSRSA